MEKSTRTSFAAPIWALAVLLLIVTLAPSARADQVTIVGSSGNLAASAAFNFSGNVLTITLTNTATVVSSVPSMLLSGVLFTLTGNPTLTPVSATASSIVQANMCNAGTCTGTNVNVGGEFSYARNGAVQEIAANGWISSNGNAGNFNGPDLDNPAALNGMNFGIVTANFNPGDGNPAMDSEPFVRNAVTFVLNGVSGLSSANLSNVSFQYGTSRSDPNFPGSCRDCGGNGEIPEPASIVLLGSIAALTLRKLRSRTA
jgi:hypothetical protein